MTLRETASDLLARYNQNFGQHDQNQFLLKPTSKRHKPRFVTLLLLIPHLVIFTSIYFVTDTLISTTDRPELKIFCIPLTKDIFNLINCKLHFKLTFSLYPALYFE